MCILPLYGMKKQTFETKSQCFNITQKSLILQFQKEMFYHHLHHISNRQRDLRKSSHHINKSTKIHLLKKPKLPFHRLVTQTRFSLRSNLVFSTRNEQRQQVRPISLAHLHIYYWSTYSVQLYVSTRTPHPLT